MPLGFGGHSGSNSRDDKFRVLQDANSKRNKGACRTSYSCLTQCGFIFIGMCIMTCIIWMYSIAGEVKNFRDLNLSALPRGSHMLRNPKKVANALKSENSAEPSQPLLAQNQDGGNNGNNGHM